MLPKTNWTKLPADVQRCLLQAEVDRGMTPRECFDAYCAYHGIIGWPLWEIAQQCREAASFNPNERT